MTNTLPEVDAAVVRDIHALSAAENYWDFRGGNSSFERAPYQYPAMMIAGLQRELMRTILRHQPGIQVVADPFLGSGTVLAETVLSRRSFLGQDINPLAVLISKARLAWQDEPLLSDLSRDCLQRAGRDQGRGDAVKFFNQDKWFTPGAKLGLSRLRAAIRAVEPKRIRQFLWTCLAETVRTSSNSRPSTFKLHIRPPTECNANEQSVLSTFRQVLEDNLKKISEFTAVLKREPANKANANPRLHIQLGDTAKSFSMPPGWKKTCYDLVVTSPPYGDNRTTVPYGQAAWLPMRWIDAEDVAPRMESANGSNAYFVDNSSLGGRIKRGTLEVATQLNDLSPSFERTSNYLRAFPSDGNKRLTCFVADLNQALESITASCQTNGYLIWTVGHRNIRGVECPLSDIVSELMVSYGVAEVWRGDRVIPSKRMAVRNKHSSTIRKETILLFRKRGVRV